jgi:hypothetical protein
VILLVSYVHPSLTLLCQGHNMQKQQKQNNYILINELLLYGLGWGLYNGRMDCKSNLGVNLGNVVCYGLL